MTTADNVLSICASIATIIACIPIFIAFISYLKNLVKGNRIIISTKFLKRFSNTPKIEINIQNKTNRAFYITRLSLLIGKIEIPILKQIHLNIDTPHSPIKIEPYQFISIDGFCHIANDSDFNVPCKLIISVANKNFFYDIKLLDNEQYNAHYCKHYKSNNRNNKSNN